MGAIDVAVFAFDMDEHAGAGEPGRRAAARAAGGAACSGAAPQRAAPGRLPRPATRRDCIDRPFGPESGRLELRRSTFRRDGKPHQLLVFADLSRALREEEQQAWQRIVRVLSHEINNSLTPIKSIAHSIKRMLSRVPDLPRAGEIQDGLNLIETRSGALGPVPARLRAARAAAEAAAAQRSRMAPLAHRHRRAREPAAGVGEGGRTTSPINADPDQLEQLLINIVRNAVDATLETGGRVWIDWEAVDGGAPGDGRRRGAGPARHVQPVRPLLHDQALRIRDRPGARAGRSRKRTAARLTLENRTGARGCRATLRLPL